MVFFRPSGTEGRPGSPSSLDGDNKLEEDGQQQPVTGIGRNLTSFAIMSKEPFIVCFF